MKLSDYQNRARATDQNPRRSQGKKASDSPTKDEVIPLLGLVGEVGGLLGEYKKLLRDGAIHRGFNDEVSEELGDILWYVANVATKFGLNLDSIASQNLKKIEERWRGPKKRQALYDTALPKDQQLPRKFSYSFRNLGRKTSRRLVIRDELNAVPFGDPLTDNAYDDDGYRYHDVLHMTFAACLGWSPVIRKLLRKSKRLKNRMPRKVDEVEDGGRAQVTEEAIVAASYSYASSHNFLEGARAIDWQLLRFIRRMTKGFEVGNRTEKEWNDTLLHGFDIWRRLRAQNGGIVMGDLNIGSIRFKRRTTA